MEEPSLQFALVIYGVVIAALAMTITARAIWLSRRAERAHAALAASEARLNEAQRIGNMGSWEWNIATNDLAWSDQIYRVFGLEPRQFVPTYPAFLARIHPDDRAAVEAAVRNAVEDRVPYDIHHRVVRPDGTVRVVRERGEVALSSDGRPLRMLGTCQDITDRVKLEAVSEEQRLLLRNVLDGMFAFVGVFSTDGALVDVNRALAESFGLNRDSLVGTLLWNTSPWAHSREMQKKVREAFARAANGEVVRGDYVVQAAAGELVAVDVIFGPLRDREGRIARVIGSGVDISARTQAEQRVRASEARLRTILESEPECVKVIDAQCRLLDMNAAGLRMLGAASIDEVRGHSVLDIVAPQYRAAFAEGVAAVFAGQTTLLQFEVVSRDGTRRWMEQHAAPLFDPEHPGTVREMLGVTRDITERVTGEQAVAKYARRLEEAQRIGNMGSWEWDFVADELSWSDQIFRIFGISGEGARPTYAAFLEYVHPDDRALLEQVVNRAKEHGEACDFDHRVILSNGELRVVHQMGEVERAPDGRSLKMVGTVQDVTALRAIETELRQSRATLSGLFTISPEGIIITDAQGRITLFSAGAEAIFGYESEEAVGQGIEFLMPERFRAGHHAHVRGFATAPEASRRMGQRAEISGRRKNGEEFPAAASLSKLDAPGGTVFTVILRDMTQEKAAREELLDAKLKAEAANLAKSRFLASMSHELRTPLNAIIGFSELLAADSLDPMIDTKRVEYAKDIQTSGKHLLNVINDILDISRIEAGKVTLSEDAVSVSDVVDTCHRMASPRAEETGVEIHRDVAPSVPHVMADRRLIMQTLLNLVSNAVKFTDKGGRVDIVARSTGDGGVEIAVRDTGIGMSEEDVKRVGEPFLQVDGRLSRNYEGTGLGLVIAKRLMELHGGKLLVESALGKGTTMTLRLPASRAVSAQGQKLLAASA